MALTISEVVEEATSTNFKLYLPPGGDCTVVNNFRKFIISDVPTIAIHIVEIIENTSDFYDEIICHRLSLIPIIITDISSMDLEFFGTTRSILVTSGDLISGGVSSTVDDIIICDLKPGQHLKLRVHLKSGTGSEHAKWSPVTNLTYVQLDSSTYQMKMEILGTVPSSYLIESALTTINSNLSLTTSKQKYLFDKAPA